MNVVTRGVRNAFRNATRTLSIVIILGLSIGLSLVMLIAYQAVQNKIKTTLSAIGNTVTVNPAGFSSGSEANNALTTDQLARVEKLPHVTGIAETLNDNLTTIGTTSHPNAPGGSSMSSQPEKSNAKTSLTSPVKLNSSNNSATSNGVVVTGGNRTLPSNFSLPVPIVGSNEPTNPFTVGATSLTITSGKAIDGTKDSRDAMVGIDLAKKNKLKVGSTFSAYGKTLTVSAIISSNTEGGDSFIIVPLPTEQDLSDEKGDVTSAVGTVDSLTNLSTTTAAIKKSLGSAADVTSNIDQANQAIQPLTSVKRVSLYSLIGAVVAGAVIILLTMIMIVRERRREIGILKAIGASNLRIMAQFMCEALTFTVLGAIIGVALGLAGGNPVTSTLVSNSNTTSTAGLPTTPGGGVIHRYGNPALDNIKNVHAQIGFTIILYGFAAAVLIALVGSALASYFISKVRPAEVLRSE